MKYFEGIDNKYFENIKSKYFHWPHDFSSLCANIWNCQIISSLNWEYSYRKGRIVSI